MDENQSKEQQDFALAPVDVAKRPKPTLERIQNRWITSDGKWHPDLAAQYILAHGGLVRWIPIGEMARVFFGANTPSNKERIRQRLYKVLQALLAKDFLLVVEYGERSAAQACKLYNPKSQTERGYVDARLTRMARLKGIKTEQYERACRLVHQADAELLDVHSD